MELQFNKISSSVGISYICMYHILKKKNGKKTIDTQYDWYRLEFLEYILCVV